jgi:hypothetical protein
MVGVSLDAGGAVGIASSGCGSLYHLCFDVKLERRP